MKAMIRLLLLLLCLLLPAGAFAETYTVPETKQGKESFLSDGNEKTYLTIAANRSVTLAGLPEGTQGVLVTWFTRPAQFKLEFLDADGIPLGKGEMRTGTMLHQYIETNGADGVRLSGAKLEIAELTAVTNPEKLPFLPNGTPCDALLLLSHVGDESLAAAPVLKELTDHGLTVQVCYLYDTQRDRKGECIDTLRALGIYREPEFCDWKAPVYDTRDSAKRGFSPAAANKLLGSLLKTYEPKLWITDAIGSGRILNHQFDTVTQAVEKHYLLIEDGPITLTLTDAEAAPLNEAYRLQRSQRIYRKEVAKTAQLALLSEGKDAGLLDGLAAESFLTYAAPTPEPTPSPTPAPTEAPTPAPTPAPTEPPKAEPTEQPTASPTEAPAKEPEKATPNRTPLWIAIALLAAGAAIWAFRKKRKA